MGWILLYFSWLTFSAYGEPKCQWPKPAKVISSELRVWTIRNNPVLDSVLAPQSEAFQQFQSWAFLQPNLADPKAKLQASLDIYKKRKLLTAPIFQRLNSVLSGEIGELRPASCWEQLVMAEAQALRPMEPSPYEIVAVTLKRRGWLRIYLLFGQSTSVVTDELESAVLGDLPEGWRVIAHLHNHPFSLREGFILNSGYTAPSESDVRAYKDWWKRFRLPEARVTNGIFTLRMKAPEFLQLP